MFNKKGKIFMMVFDKELSLESICVVKTGNFRRSVLDVTF